MGYFRRALAGVQSQPIGGRVSRAALEGTQGPAWYRELQGSSLGDAPVEAGTTLGTAVDPTTKFQADLLTSSRNIEAHERERIRAERVRGYLQLGATLSIPLAAALWRWIGIGKKKRKST